MDDRLYIQDENETSDWLIYAEYVEWAIRSGQAGMSQPKIEDRCLQDSQRNALDKLKFE